MTDLSVFRVYAPWECGEDDYPEVWHRNPIRPRRESDPPPGVSDDAYRGALDDVIIATLELHAGYIDFASGVKHIVRAEARHRCVRCGHPYVVGQSGRAAEAAEEAAAADPALQATLDRFPDAGTSAQPLLSRSAPKTNWSACDERCTHKGPVRVWVTAEDADEESHWWETTAMQPVGELTAAGDRIEVPWRILTVHHLNGRKHDLRWHNLVSLCQRCHLYIQRKVIMERVFPLEHSEWFQPYAAGFYAASYLGEELTREQTMSRLEELLALERLA